MTIAAGTTLGRYEIRSLIGAGGMGEVYLAYDNQMRRPVALKLLPGNFTQDEDRLRRFEQEAYSASGLNHPNILTIYEIGESNATRFIAMEYVEGETLRHYLSRAHGSGEGFAGGGVKLHDAIEIAIQIASAIAASQAANIAHRDIKPENIILRRDGYVKVLDFGLAKLTERATTTTDTEAPTRAMVNTSPGAVMGTVNYMSPEQASGHQVDARTDIWSLGVLLYEMVTGHLPFEGPTPSHVIVSILEKDPPLLARYISDVPEALEWIISKALTKKREDRYTTAHEMHIDLRRLKQRLDASAEMERSVAPDDFPSRHPHTLSGSRPASTVSAFPLDQQTAPVRTETMSSAEYLAKSMGRHKLAVGVAIAALAVLVAGGIVLWSKFGRTTSHTFRKIRLSQLTSTGKAGLATISADGRYVVHVLSDGTQSSLWMRQVATSSNVQIQPPSSARYIGLTFSQDGNYIYYVVYDGNNPLGVAYQLPVLGGTPRKVLEDVDTPLTFSPDGKRVVWVRQFPQSGETALMIANSDGSEVRKLASRARPSRFVAGTGIGPTWAPEGDTIACPVGGPVNGLDRYSVVMINASSAAETRATSQLWTFVQQTAWLPQGGGMLIAAQEEQGGPNQIWHMTVPGGAVERVTNDLNNYNGVSLAASGTKFVTVQTQVSSSIWFAPHADTDSAVKVTSGTNEGSRGLAVTPDGKILYSAGGASTADLYIANSDGSSPRQLTSGAGINAVPSVSADGRTIVFVSNRNGTPHLWRMDSDGNNARQLTNGVAEVNPDISPDGQWVVFQNVPDLGLSKISIDGGPITQISNKLVSQATVSPDGKLLACRYREQDLSPFKLAILDFATGQVVKAIDTPPINNIYRWSTDGKSVLYVLSRNGVANIWSQPIDGSAPKQLTNFKSDLIFGFNYSRDGKSLALARGTVSNDVLLISDVPD
jgi:serine/threonine protein kinase